MCMAKTDWERCVEFHGHACPGLAIGYKASLAAIKKLGIGFSRDEEIVCVTENDACGVDAVQLLTGCTLGKGNLIYRNTGKKAFSFFNRKTGDSVRVVAKAVFNKNIDREAMQKFILEAPVEELFDFKTPSFKIPDNARIFTTVICESCGEGASENKIRLLEGRKVCHDCFEDYSRGWCDCLRRIG